MRLIKKIFGVKKKPNKKCTYVYPVGSRQLLPRPVFLDSKELRYDIIHYKNFEIEVLEHGVLHKYTNAIKATVATCSFCECKYRIKGVLLNESELPPCPECRM